MTDRMRRLRQEWDMGIDGVVGTSWLRVLGLDSDAGVVVVRVVGSAVAERAEELWSELEGVFERMPGDVVVADLSALTSFDHDTARELMCVARDAARRRDVFRVVARQSGALAQYLRWSVPGEGLGTYGSVGEAVAGVEAEDRYWEPVPATPWGTGTDLLAG
jgi:anti-anti-sigma regulatory factor